MNGVGVGEWERGGVGLHRARRVFVGFRRVFGSVSGGRGRGGGVGCRRVFIGFRRVFGGVRVGLGS